MDPISFTNQSLHLKLNDICVTSTMKIMLTIPNGNVTLYAITIKKFFFLKKMRTSIEIWKKYNYVYKRRLSWEKKTRWTSNQLDKRNNRQSRDGDLAHLEMVRQWSLSKEQYKILRHAPVFLFIHRGWDVSCLHIYLFSSVLNDLNNNNKYYPKTLYQQYKSFLAHTCWPCSP